MSQRQDQWEIGKLMERSENLASVNADLLDRIKVLEGEVEDWKSKYEEEYRIVTTIWRTLGISTYEQAKPFSICEHVENLKSLLHRCLNTGLRDDKARPLYLEVCRVLGVDPDKPWEDKGGIDKLAEWQVREHNKST